MSSCEALREDLKWLWLTFLTSCAFGQQINRKGAKTNTNLLKGRASRRAVLKEFEGECFASWHLLLRSCAPKVSKMMLWEPAGAQKSWKFRKSSKYWHKLPNAHLIWSLKLRFECLPVKLYMKIWNAFDSLFSLLVPSDSRFTEKSKKRLQTRWRSNFPKGGTRAVSYTHLTLPTILLV